jgi:hypothetical protein
MRILRIHACKAIFLALPFALVQTPSAQAADLGVPGVSVAQPSSWKFAVTPRVWFAWENDSFFQDTNPGVQQSQEVYFYPFYGGSLTAVSPGGTSYSITGLHGEGDAEVSGVIAGALPQTFHGTVENKRTDIEAIAQPQIAEGVVGTLGARYINFQRNERDQFFFCDAINCDLDLSGTGRFDLEQNFWLGELGFGVSRPVGAMRRWIFFGNVTGMFGFADLVKFNVPGGGGTGVFNLQKGQLDGAVIGVDTNAGVGFKLTESMLLSARYRLFYLSAPDVRFDIGGNFIQGPEVNLSFSW